jgi:hypothetical protein
LLKRMPLRSAPDGRATRRSKRSDSKSLIRS